MKSQSTIRRSMIATLLVFATAAIGLQSLAFTSGSACGCSCSATETVEAVQSVTESPCCPSPVQDSESNCCSTKQTTPTKGCCCNPNAFVCECDDCGCSEDNDNHSPLPAIPTNETTEVVTPVLICAAPIVGYPCGREVQRVDYQNIAAEFAALSSQETCVLLSRFTC